MPKIPKDLFGTVVETGKHYVRVEYIMHPLIAMVCGLPVYFLGKGKKERAYLSFDDAEAWLEEEYKRGGDELHLKTFNKLRELRGELDLKPGTVLA